MAPTSHSVEIDDDGPLVLPVRKVNDTTSLAIFNLLGDWKLTERVGMAMAEMLRMSRDSAQLANAILCPDGKAQALGHVVGRELCLPVVFARKELKSYMSVGSLRAGARSITTKQSEFWLDVDDAEKIRGKRVIILDDVVSGGGTLAAMRDLLKQAGADEVRTAAVFVEGKTRLDVWCLNTLPVWVEAEKSECELFGIPHSYVLFLDGLHCSRCPQFIRHRASGQTT